MRPPCIRQFAQASHSAAFDPDEGTVRTFQIALVGEPRDKYGGGGSRSNRLTHMAPYWLVRFNDLTAWLNPVLAGVAALLAMLVIAVAAERFPAYAARPAVQSARQISVVAPAKSPHAVLPPELRDLRLYD